MPGKYTPTQLLDQTTILKSMKRGQITEIFGLITKMRMIACHVFLRDYKVSNVPLGQFRKKYMSFILKLKIKRKSQNATFFFTKLALHRNDYRWKLKLTNCGKYMISGISL